MPLRITPEEWDVAPLGALTSKIGSGATPLGGEANYLRERSIYALIRSQSVFDRYFERSTLSFISDEQAAQLRSANVEPGDVLLNITGDGITFGRAALVPEDVLPACVNQHVAIVRPNPAKLNSGFLLAYLTHPSIKPYIESFNAGGSRRAITKGNIESFIVPLPPLAEQRAIAGVLGALDDKIEANRRMNTTLEAMARALFKSWFVDFDPVRAKLEGREPALAPSLQEPGIAGDAGGLAALFPARLTDSPLGPIPEGWEVSDLSALAELNPESWGRSDYPDEIDYLDLANTKWGEISEVQLFERSEAPSRAQRVLRRGDTVVATVRPGNGGYALIDRDGLTGSTGFAALRPVNAAREFVYLRATARETIELLAHLADGGAYPAVRPQAVIDLETVVPPPIVLHSFSEFSGPWLDRIAAARAGSRTLAQLRDLLLPKLLSGALRVRDAERLVDHAGG